jgi:hypothetical protein
MTISLRDALDVAQALGGIVTPVTILLALRQLRLGRQQVQKQSDTAAVNFVLTAEGQFDGMVEAFASASPAVIKQAYFAEIDEHWTDDELRAFVYIRRLFGHISRMVFIIKNPAIDIGFNREDRAKLLDDWENTLRKYEYNPIMRHVYHNAVRFQDYNDYMMDLCKEVFVSEGVSSDLAQNS